MFLFCLSREDVAISDAIHRELNDVVDRMTDHGVSGGWRKNYKIFLSSDGQIDARPKGPGSPMAFKSGLTNKPVVLPTPKWVCDSKQTRYICFSYELPGLMNQWWEEYEKLM
jgi:hypothetical protein